VRPGSEVGSTTGDVLLDTVLKGEGIAVNCAVLKPGARTFWHTHERGQLFFISSGKGMIATRDGQAQIVQAGDVVWTPPGEEHWHGAAPDAFVTYTAISLGKSTFNAEVSDDEYAQTWT
jgi:quercetin dioxygenase-like cupin family protein